MLEADAFLRKMRQKWTEVELIMLDMWRKTS